MYHYDYVCVGQIYGCSIRWVRAIYLSVSLRVVVKCLPYAQALEYGLRAHAALPHLHNRHGDRCTFCATKSLKKVNSSRFKDFMSFDYQQTPVDGVQRFCTSIACSALACR